MGYPEIQLSRPPSSVRVVPFRSGGDSAGTQGETVGESETELAGLRSARQALQQAGYECRQIREQFLKEAQEQLVDMSIEIARKVLMQEIEADRHKIDPFVTEALSRVPGRVDIVVHLHPDDLARCEQARNSEKQEENSEIRFVSDPKVKRGGCLLETSRGDVESSIDGQLEEISQALKDPE